MVTKPCGKRAFGRVSSIAHEGDTANLTQKTTKGLSQKVTKITTDLSTEPLCDLCDLLWKIAATFFDHAQNDFANGKRSGTEGQRDHERTFSNKLFVISAIFCEKPSRPPVITRETTSPMDKRSGTEGHRDHEGTFSNKLLVISAIFCEKPSRPPVITRS